MDSILRLKQSDSRTHLLNHRIELYSVVQEQPGTIMEKNLTVGQKFVVLWVTYEIKKNLILD